jgi:hypothetical protein
VAVKIRIVSAQLIAANNAIFAPLDSELPLRCPPEPAQVSVKLPYFLRRGHLAIVLYSEVQLRSHYQATAPRTLADKFLGNRHKSIL